MIMNKFLNEHWNKVALVILVLIYFKSCSNGSDIKAVRKEIVKIETKIDSLPTGRDIRIEGLKVEKRMIQSTDRKILDVNRQSEIEKEIGQ